MKTVNFKKIKFISSRVPMLFGMRLQKIFFLAFMMLLIAATFNAANQRLLAQSLTAKKIIELHALVSPAIAKVEKESHKVSIKKNTVQKETIITTAAVMTQVRKTAKRYRLRILDLSTAIRLEQSGDWLMVNIEAHGSYYNIKKMVSAFQRNYNQLRLDTLRIEKTGRKGGLTVWLKFTPGQIRQDI